MQNDLASYFYSNEIPFQTIIFVNSTFRLLFIKRNLVLDTVMAETVPVPAIRATSAHRGEISMRELV